MIVLSLKNMWIKSIMVKLYDLTKVKLKTAGNTSVVQFTAGNFQSPKSVRKSINRLMDLIRCNATDSAKCKWLTVTYKVVMTAKI